MELYDNFCKGLAFVYTGIIADLPQPANLPSALLPTLTLPGALSRKTRRGARAHFITTRSVILLLRFTGPPVPITARVHSAPRKQGLLRA
eukprot:1190726-Prorocentrum_minimum.AAC.2